LLRLLEIKAKASIDVLALIFIRLFFNNLVM
jgi:hypothetical protein